MINRNQTLPSGGPITPYTFSNAAYTGNDAFMFSLTHETDLYPPSNAVIPEKLYSITIPAGNVHTVYRETADDRRYAPIGASAGFSAGLLNDAPGEKPEIRGGELPQGKVALFREKTVFPSFLRGCI